ncbi:MAG: HD domain-containing phosphohydrolase [Nitrospirota bacterium]
MYKKNKKSLVKENNFICYGLVLVLLWWIGESFIDVYIFHENNLSQQLFSPDYHEFWMRSLTTLMLVIFIVYVRFVITKKRHAVNRLEQSEMRFYSVVESATDAIILTDNSGNVLSWNSGAESIFGYPKEEVLEKSITLLIPEKYKNAHINGFNRAYSSGKSDLAGKTIELQGLKKDGTEFPLELTLSRWKIEEKTFYSSIIRDITRRKKAEEELEEEKNKLQAIVEAIEYGLSIQDRDYNILYQNHILRDKFGRIGEKCYWVYENNDKICDGCPIETAYREGISHTEEKMATMPSGDIVYWENTANPIRNAKGEIAACLMVVRDITDRKRLEKQTQFRVKRLNALYSIEKAITSTLDLRITLDLLLDKIISHLEIDAADILLLNPGTMMLEYAAAHGFRTMALKYTQLRLGESHAGRAAKLCQIVNIPNLNKDFDDFNQSTLLPLENFVEYYAVPLIAKGKVKGVLEIFNRSPFEADQEWLEFLNTLSSQVAIAIDNVTLFENLQHSNDELVIAYDTTIEGWSRAMDLKDKETEGHSRRVTDMTLRIARELGIKKNELIHIKRGALLHDMGKLGIPDRILLKPGKLTEEEWKIMKQHPVYAYDMLYPIEYLRPAIDIPYCHHEKWDGTGYPRGLRGEEIPLSARIFALVDVWDALRSDRPYRPAWSKEKTFENIISNSGTHFDSEIVKIFLKMDL